LAPAVDFTAGKERSLLGRDALTQIGIFQGGFGDEIDFTPKKSRQRIAQAKIGFGVAAWRHRFEFDEKIDVAVRSVETIIGCGTEKVEPAHPEPEDKASSAESLGSKDAGVPGLGCKSGHPPRNVAQLRR
jgi:hypothetical protein